MESGELAESPLRLLLDIMLRCLGFNVGGIGLRGTRATNEVPADVAE